MRNIITLAISLIINTIIFMIVFGQYAVIEAQKNLYKNIINDDYIVNGYIEPIGLITISLLAVSGGLLGFCSFQKEKDKTKVPRRIIVLGVYSITVSFATLLFIAIQFFT